MNKKIISIITLLVLIILLSSIGLYIHSKKQAFDNIKVNYISIENTYFDYNIENINNHLTCDINVDNIITKGNNITLSCKDDFFNFINFEKEIKIDNVLTTYINEDKLKSLISDKFQGQTFYKVDDSITIINITDNKDNTYKINVYDDIYYDGQELKSYNIKKDNFIIQDIKLTIKEDDISYLVLNERINSYLNSGYIKIEN